MEKLPDNKIIHLNPEKRRDENDKVGLNLRKVRNETGVYAVDPEKWNKFKEAVSKPFDPGTASKLDKQLAEYFRKLKGNEHDLRAQFYLSEEKHWKENPYAYKTLLEALEEIGVRDNSGPAWNEPYEKSSAGTNSG